ncbi:MAG: hypothetical protein H5U40_06695, partial [Polyangiaceae bacterium]|nr:hypothetical protein [Polyangiaceae bacterium]
MSNQRLPAFAISAALALVLASVAPSFEETAAAQGGQRAQIWLVQGTLPRLATQQALLGFARSHNARRLQENTDVPIRDRRWQGNIVAKFSRPLGDVQFSV